MASLEKLQQEMGHGGVEIETAEPVAAAIISELNNLPDISVREQQDRKLIAVQPAPMSISP